MVMGKRELERASSPSKVKRFTKRRSKDFTSKPSTSGSTYKQNLNSDNATQTRIKVIIRVRPPNDREDQDNHRTIIGVVDDKMLIFDPKVEENPFFYRGVAQKGRDLLKKQNKELQFIFDHVFNMECTNTEVFEGTTKEIISDLLDGYNCSVFAYGATGAGKTHTMLGKDQDPGITYRTMAELFSQIEEQTEVRDFTLGVTYLEIYNENVQDLLHKTGPLALREDARGVVVAGLKIFPIKNADELLSLLAQGNRNRTQHPTDANAESSRSHAVFQVYVNMTNKLDGQVKQVKLSMIDLAGSERASATGCKGARFKEGANINKSLLALGNCINKLAEGIKHIPYRDSKLTRLLKDSLGGNCRTVMIANVGPSSMTYEDTYNTLRYADRAKKIKTSMKKNIISCEMHVTGYIKLVEELKKEIAQLKQQAKRNSGQRPSPQSQPDTTEDDKQLKDFRERLVALLERKRTLNDKILSFQSADKILCCRIQYKTAADKRLKYLTSAVDLIAEEQNASGKSRVNKSLLYFKRQREVVKVQMKDVWTELQDVELDLSSLVSSIQAKGFTAKLTDTVATHKSALDNLRLQHQYDHARKISSIQQCEMESLETINRAVSTTLQKYYAMMRGGGSLTEGMNAEFKKMVKSLEGVRNIKWADDDIGTVQDSYSLTCLSLEELEDSRNCEMPIHNPSYNLQEDSPARANTNCVLDPTTPPSELEFADCEKSETSNTTVTLGDEEDVACDGPSSEIDPNQLNSTFNLAENKARKRPMPDKTAALGKTVVKQAKKISPKRVSPKATPSAPALNGLVSKDSKPTPRATMMSAKSIAILNKLRNDRQKLLHPSTSTVVAAAAAAAAERPGPSDGLKAVRTKERRMLQTTHPYQKNPPKFK